MAAAAWDRPLAGVELVICGDHGGSTFTLGLRLAVRTPGTGPIALDRLPDAQPMQAPSCSGLPAQRALFVRAGRNAAAGSELSA
jgi:hypothetical protein